MSNWATNWLISWTNRRPVGTSVIISWQQKQINCRSGRGKESERGTEILFAFANIAAIKNKYLRPKKDQAQSEHMQEAAAGAAGSVCEIRAPLLHSSTPNPSARQPSARTLDTEPS